MKTISFFVPGIPATAGSKTPFIYKSKADGKNKVAMAPANKRQKSWMAVVQLTASKACGDTPPLSGPLKLVVMFYLPRPKYHYRTGKHVGTLKDDASIYHDKKPDSFKLCRAVEDAMKGVVYHDDSQICQHVIDKVYAEVPGCSVVVQALME